MKRRFGIYVSNKRKEKNFSLRSFSQMIGISPEYLSKIENNSRAAPRDVIIERIANILTLNSREKEFLFDLAAESKPYMSLASDLVKYVNENKMAHKTLRLAKRKNLTNKDWEELFEYISKYYL